MGCVPDRLVARGYGRLAPCRDLCPIHSWAPFLRSPMGLALPAPALTDGVRFWVIPNESVRQVPQSISEPCSTSGASHPTTVNAGVSEVGPSHTAQSWIGTPTGKVIVEVDPLRPRSAADPEAKESYAECRMSSWAWLWAVDFHVHTPASEDERDADVWDGWRHRRGCTGRGARRHRHYRSQHCVVLR